MSVSLKNFFAKIPKIITVVFSVDIAGPLLLNVILNNSFNQHFKPNLLSISSILPFGAAVAVCGSNLDLLVCGQTKRRIGAGLLFNTCADFSFCFYNSAFHFLQFLFLYRLGCRNCNRHRV